MMPKNNIFIIISVVLLLEYLHVSASEIANKTGEFVATKEWQVINEGQAIPKGLHVRVNLQTGLKEAKLLDKSERGTALQNQAGESDEESEKATIEPLSLEYKADQIVESVRKVKEQRSYAELRKAYKEFQKKFQTDAEVIVHLLEQFRNFSKTPVSSELKPKLNVLENFEYMLHQFDNALVFITNGGLEDVLLPIVVNDTNTALRISAMRVLGALAGNNPQAQIKVFERNFGSHLAQILMTSTDSLEISSAMHAFGALLRKFPLAQQRILSTSGTQALINVLRSADVDQRNKAKVATLISDLILEKQYALDADKDSPDYATTIAQYILLDFDAWLQAHNYCTTLETVLSKDFVQLLDQPDVVEKFTVALESTHSLCKSAWNQSAPLRHALLTIRNRFALSQDEYRLEVSETLKTLCERFYGKPNRTEL